MDINIDTLRGRLVSSSTNSSRVLLAHLNVLSVPYHKRIEVQSNTLTWDKEVEISKKENFLLSYATPKVEEEKMTNKIADYNPENGKQHANNEVFTLNNIFDPQGKGVAFNNPNTSMS